ncbi:MAG: MdtA/MuxA family multidrug efflux RND transporter periplasmic adaptor subunit [Rhodocyclales bacterium]|nr:MdtA/MuxA family multidrug efflux RND transporter periplasmic adaptor subunit [Rhodocyclales bacterium]
MSDQTPSAAPQASTASRLAHRRRWLRFTLALILAALAGGGWYVWARQAETQQQAARGRDRLSPIVVEAARTENFPLRLAAVGSVAPRNIVIVRSRVDGALDRLLFEEGQVVRAGTLLAEIDPRPFEVALTQAQGQLGKDQALLANARADLGRYEGLARLDAIPVQQLDTQRALVGQYEASVKADQGTVDSARLQLSYTHITAPIDGRVGLRQVDPGNVVRASDANGIVVITQVQPVTVVFPIPEAELGKLLARLGLQVPRARGDAPRERGGIEVEAWDRDGKLLLATGKLLTVDNQIDATTGTVKVKAVFPNADGALFPNQFVNVRLVVAELKDATVIPSAAVQRGSRGNFVWLLNPEEKTVAMRQVSLGSVDGELVPVLDGLKDGEQVAVDGFDRLREGAKVEVVTRESRAVKEGTGKRGARGGRRGGEGGPQGERGSRGNAGPKPQP